MFKRSNQSIFGDWWWQIDKINFLLIILLLFIGVICVTSGSFSVAKKIDVHSGYFIVKHMYYAVFSLLLIIAISMLDYRVIYKLTPYFFLLFLFLTIMTFFFGTQIKGSKRWLYFFGFSLQPSEFLKIMFIALNAVLLSELERHNHLKIYLASFALCLFCVGVVFLQPDVGMGLLIFCSWLVQVFISGVPIILLVIPVIFLICGISFAYLFFEHVQYRINNFIKSFSNETEIYQVKQAIAAFSKGKLFGLGPGQGKIKTSLPDAHTDFIFSVIAEEFGIISCVMIIVLYLLITWRSLRKVLDEQDLFKIFLVSGLSLQFIMQAFINIGVNIRLLPAKGMTLPLISYGGSSMLSISFLLGIIIAINKKKYGYLKNF